MGKEGERIPNEKRDKNGQGMTTQGMRPFCQSVHPPRGGCTSNMCSDAFRDVHNDTVFSTDVREKWCSF
jgi:hypothetical protein